MMPILTDNDRTLMLGQLKRHEGTRRDKQGLHIAYRCTSDALTIGYGHNLDANPVPGITAKSRLSEDQALRLLAADVAVVERQLDEALPWARSLDAPRYAVLVNMAFNMGMGVKGGKRGLLSFRNTLGMIERGEYERAGMGMLDSQWRKDVKGRAVELAGQMRTGEWQTGARR